VSQYVPDVQCSSPRAGARAPDIRYCQPLLNAMPAGKFPQIFGSRGTPAVQVPLPIAIADSETPSNLP